MLARELATLNDPVLKTGSFDDCCVAAGQAERRLPVLDRAPANLEAHGSASSLGAFHGHLLSAGLFLMSRHDTRAICWQDGHDRFHHFPVGLSGAQESREPPNNRMHATASVLGCAGGRDGHAPAAPDA